MKDLYTDWANYIGEEDRDEAKSLFYKAVFCTDMEMHELLKTFDEDFFIRVDEMMNDICLTDMYNLEESLESWCAWVLSRNAFFDYVRVDKTGKCVMGRANGSAISLNCPFQIETDVYWYRRGASVEATSERPFHPSDDLVLKIEEGLLREAQLQSEISTLNNVIDDREETINSLEEQL